MKKHAYIIVANSLSDVLLTCVRMLDDPFNDIYVLFDRKAHFITHTQPLKQCVQHSKWEFCEQLVNWAGYSQIAAVMTLLKRACSKQRQYAYIHFLQG